MIRSTSTPAAAGKATPASAPGLLPGVQLLRGIAALLVVCAHANVLMGYPEYFRRRPFGFEDCGLFGVAVFFVISGFIIAIVSLRDDLTPRLTRREFGRRRFLRIMPFLWVSVVGYNLLSFAGTGTVEWLAFARALAVWPVGELKPNVVWSLRHEWLFYGLFAWLMLGTRVRLLPIALWCLAPLICWPLLQWSGSTIPDDPGPWAELFRVVLLGARSGANLQFGAGLLLGIAYLRRHRAMAPRDIGLGWTLLATLAAAIVVELILLPIGLARSIAWTLLAVPPVWLAIVTVPRTGAFMRVGNALGDSSFALYLVHNATLLILLELSRRVTGVPVAASFVLIVLGAVGTGIVAHLLVEKPLVGTLAHGKPLAPWLRRRRADPPNRA